MENNVKTTQQKFEVIERTMLDKIGLIAEYTDQEMIEYSAMELKSLETYITSVFKDIKELLSGKLI